MLEYCIFSLTSPLAGFVLGNISELDFLRGELVEGELTTERNHLFPFSVFLSVQILGHTCKIASWFASWFVLGSPVSSNPRPHP